MASTENFGLNKESFQRQLKALLPQESLDSVLVALSGGPDSVALLHLFHQIAEEWGFELSVAHVNYRLRGDESDEDERFCIHLCRELGLPLFRKRVPRDSMQSRNIQDRARQIRYDYFEKLAEQHGIEWIATGHNKDDNVETILFNLFRGAGSFGLSGISPRSGKLIRPLLGFSRKHVLSYLDDVELEYRSDSTNLEDKYARNRIRHRLIPEIEAQFSGSGENITRAAEIIREQSDYLLGRAQHLLKRSSSTTPAGKIVLDLRGFANYHKSLQRIALAVAYERLTGSRRGLELAATERVLRLVRSDQRRTDFSSNCFAEIAGDKLYIYRRGGSNRPTELAIPGSADLPRLGLRLKTDLMHSAKISFRQLKSGGDIVYLDRTRLSDTLTVRTRRAGDRFQPLGMSESKKLSDFFIDRKVDRPLRDEIPLVLAGRRIVWVAGYEIAEFARVSRDTREVVKLEVCENRKS
jgi:tRNA(Ile)-lysidine synthase